MKLNKIKYNPYSFCSYENISGFKKINIIDKNISGLNALHEVIKVIYDFDSSIIQGITGDVLSEEYQWLYQSNRNVIFPQSKMLLKDIINIKFDDKFHFNPTFDSFMLMFPSHFKYQNFDQFEGALVTISTLAALHKNKNLFYSDILSEKKVKFINELNYNFRNPNQTCISISYKMPADYIESSNKANTRESKEAITYRCTLTEEQIKTALLSNSVDEYKKIGGRIDLNCDLDATLNDIEIKYQYALLKVVSSLLVFLQATQNKYLKPGLPHQHIKNLSDIALNQGSINAINLMNPESDIKKTTGSATINKTHSTHSKKPHSRSWHIRAYMNEKYYKGKDWIDKPRGTRLTFIPGSWVGGDINANTIVE